MRTERVVDCSVTPDMEREGIPAIWDEEWTDEEWATRNLDYVDPVVQARRVARARALIRLKANAKHDEMLRDLLTVLGVPLD